MCKAEKYFYNYRFKHFELGFNMNYLFSEENFDFLKK